MRVGLFSDYYLGSNDGTAIATEASRRALVDLGHTVRIFCPAIPKVKKKSYVYAIKSWPAFMYPGLRACWPFNKRVLQSVNDLDIVHLETPLPVGLLGLWAARKLGKTTVMSAHLDMDFMGEYGIAPIALFLLGLLVATICRQPLGLVKALFGRPRNLELSRRADFAWRIYAFYGDQADGCVAVSQKIYDQLKVYKQKDNLYLVPNGLDLPLEKLPSRQRLRSQLAWNKDELVVISLARLVREKQVELVIKAVQLLPKNSKIRLAIFNDGPVKHDLEALVGQLGLSSRVKFYGFVPRLQLRRYIVAADIFINSSQREAYNLAALEAALCGKPLLLFDRRLVELLDDGINGFFVDSPKKLASKLEWFARNPHEVSSRGRASRRRVKLRYSQTAHGRGLERLYMQLIKES